MFGVHCPNDVFQIVTDFAWGKKLKYSDLLRQIELTTDVQDSIPYFLLNVVVFDSKIYTWVPSPFRPCFPFYPLVDIDKTSIWSETLKYFPNTINSTFFRTNHTYRNCFRRHVERLFLSGFSSYNFLLNKYLSKLTVNDFPSELNFSEMVQILLQGAPLLKHSGLVF
jgi:hypothetical protein